MYILRLTETFLAQKTKILGNDEQLNKRLKSTLQKLSLNPIYPSLRSHKVNTPDYGIRWSSWVTEDMRIIWDYDENERLVIVLLDIGMHSGSHKVYK